MDEEIVTVGCLKCEAAVCGAEDLILVSDGSVMKRVCVKKLHKTAGLQFIPRDDPRNPREIWVDPQILEALLCVKGHFLGGKIPSLLQRGAPSDVFLDEGCLEIKITQGCGSCHVVLKDWKDNIQAKCELGEFSVSSSSSGAEHVAVRQVALDNPPNTSKLDDQSGLPSITSPTKWIPRGNLMVLGQGASTSNSDREFDRCMNVEVTFTGQNKLLQMDIRNQNYESFKRLLLGAFPELNASVQFPTVSKIVITSLDGVKDPIIIDSDESFQNVISGRNSRGDVPARFSIRVIDQRRDQDHNSKVNRKSSSSSSCRKRPWQADYVRKSYDENSSSSICSAPSRRPRLDDMERWFDNLLTISNASQLISFLSSSEGFRMLTRMVKSRTLSSEIVSKLVNLLMQDDVRLSLRRHDTNKIYGAFLGSALLTLIPGHIREIVQPTANEVWPFVHLFHELQNRTTDGWKCIPVDALIEAIDRIPEGSGANKSELNEYVLKLVEHRNKLKRLQIGAAKSESSSQATFKWLSILPTEEEICSDHVRPETLPGNRIGRNYRNMDEYLSTHFYLLREGCFASTRHAIRRFRENIVPEDARIYDQVKLSEILCGASGLEYCVSFKVPKRKAIDWNISKRLMAGSLLCISCDRFQNYMWAVVTRREAKQLAKGLVVLQLIFADQGKDGEYLESNRNYEMFESAAAYFEPYDNVLKCLQLPEMDDLPFSEHFLTLEHEVKEPSYLGQREMEDAYDLECAFPTIRSCLGRSTIHILQKWPEWNSSLDDSQMEAVKHALTKRLALIQGPPGTGKTFVGLKIVNILLSNLTRRKLQSQTGDETCDIKGPILVICYTSHALDQFLESIYSIEKNIVRLGSRSANETVSRLTLEELKHTTVDASRRSSPGSKFNRDQTTENRRRQLTQQKNSLQTRIQACSQLLTGNIASKETLQSVASKQHIESLYSEDSFYSNVMHSWLKGSSYHRGDHEDQEPCADKSGNRSYDSFATPNAVLEDSENFSTLAAIGASVETEKENFAKCSDEITTGKPIAGTDKLDYATATAKDNVETASETGILESEEEQTDCSDDDDSKSEVTVNEILDSEDLWVLPAKSRRKLYKYWLGKAKEDLQLLSQEYQEVCDMLSEIDLEADLAILTEAKVVGMTTSAAAKNYKVLKSLKAEILVIEEAAEVLEAHVLACVGPFTKHLILIGDHLQLRPSVTVHGLATKNRLGISLFERLIRGGVEHATLRYQRRMRPCISSLISDVYPSLMDHGSLKKFENVKGIYTNLFFFDHKAMESHSNDGVRSKVNMEEAQLVVEFCMYLLRQGYKRSDIVILTMYAGQTCEIQQRLQTRIHMRGGGWESDEDTPRVCSVDDFRGEECNIVILSLVRGTDGKIGFLNVSNRVCVVLSRAKCGLYMFGDAQLLGSKCSLWESVIQKLRRSDCIGQQLTLTCQNHPQTETKVSAIEDFRQVEDGGCSRPCESQLKCGHACARRCHASNHDRIVCSKPCPLKFDSSRCGHQCTRLCHFPTECPPCQVLVAKTLPRCGHQIMLPCSTPVDHALCDEPCDRTFDCGHRCPSKCGRPCGPCEMRVPKDLPCGHRATLPCHQDVTAYDCAEPCGEILSPGCEHKCGGTCGSCNHGTSHIPCRKQCLRPLPCGHQCLAGCSEICPPCGEECEKRCLHSRCALICGAPCRPCVEKCEWNCEHHRCDLLCHEICVRPRCDQPCTKTLRFCGHPCIGLCGEPCPKLCRICHPKHLDVISQMTLDEHDSSDRFVQLLDCEHAFEVSGLDRWMDMDDVVLGIDTRAHVAVKLKRCPECRSPIRRTLRYSNAVKRKLQQIEQVKKRIKAFENVNRGNDMLMKRNYSEALKKFTAALDDDLGILEAHFGKACALCGHRDYDEAIQHLSFVIERSSYKTLVETEIPNLKLNRDRPSFNCNTAGISRHEAEEELAENALLQWASACSAVNDFPNGIAICNVILKKNPGNSKALEMKENVKMNRGVVQGAIEAVTREVGGRGHWYQCPNGHYYAVGECGGPTQTSECPDCKAVVGGQSHNPAEGNIHSDIYDASHSAWSGV